MKAAIRLGLNHEETLETYKNMNFEEILNFFNITKKLVVDNPEEIRNVKTIDITLPRWTKSTSAHDQVTQWTTADVRVCSDSVLCLREMSHISEAGGRWTGPVEEFKVSY